MPTELEVSVDVGPGTRRFQWRMAQLQHVVRGLNGDYRLERVVEPPEAFRLRPTRCINRSCGVRLNMPGSIGTCSAVCRNAVDAQLIHISRERKR